MNKPGIELADLTWLEAERQLTSQAVVMIPLGAAAKEHGLHLRLDNDYRMASALKDLVMSRIRVLVAPTVAYHHYPAFAAYPGSTSLAFDTARDLILDIVHSFATHGPRRFYVLNTGVSTVGPLQAAADSLRDAGILLRYTDIMAVAAEVEREVMQQQRGSHADEIETSIMLYLTPERVDMQKAVADQQPHQGRGGLSRVPGQPGVYSASGVWGDPTLADAHKGKRIVDAMVDGIVRDIQNLQQESL